MSDIAEKISLIVCQKCEKRENETEIDFATRLYNLYHACYDEIEKLPKRSDSDYEPLDHFNF